ncbi:MAG: 2-oxo acid dehydrogenase subunit E2, partial [Phycicoccus sp.]
MNRRQRVTQARTRTSVRRKIAVATWRPSRDGRIYARMEADVTAALAYCDRVRAATGIKVSLTHVVGAALGRALREMPEIRARVVLGRVTPLVSCDIGFAVDIERGSDLAPVKVLAVDRMTPAEVATAVDAGAVRLRRGEDAA